MGIDTDPGEDTLHLRCRVMTGRALRYAAIGTVAAQGALLVVFFTVPGGDDWAVPGWLSDIASAVQIAGWAVLLAALANLGRSLTVLPTPTERSTLQTTGLYRLVRHPIYTGLLAIVLGAALGSGRAVKMLLALALLGVLRAEARWEEDMLRRRYPSYDDYAARTHRFLPRPFHRCTPAARGRVELPDGIPWAPVLAVVAHPDDESFGLGALLTALVDSGREVSVLCLTHGEASTLGTRAALAEVRGAELTLAAQRLGVSKVTLDDFPDGGLADVEAEQLDRTIERHLGDAGLLIIFEPGGVTGHPDHQAATAAAERVATRHGLPVLEWGVAPEVADVLRRETGAGFVALDGAGVTDLTVDRTRQRAAIACHTSQATDNPVLLRRISLQGDRERIRLRSPRSGPSGRPGC